MILRPEPIVPVDKRFNTIQVKQHQYIDPDQSHDSNCLSVSGEYMATNIGERLLVFKINTFRSRKTWAQGQNAMVAGMQQFGRNNDSVIVKLRPSGTTLEQEFMKFYNVKAPKDVPSAFKKAFYYITVYDEEDSVEPKGKNFWVSYRAYEDLPVLKDKIGSGKTLKKGDKLIVKINNSYWDAKVINNDTKNKQVTVNAWRGKECLENCMYARYDVKWEDAKLPFPPFVNKIFDHHN